MEGGLPVTLTHRGGSLVSPPCLVQVNGTPVFHCHGPYWLIAGYWHGGWASCDTHTSGGSLVSPAVLSKSMVLQSFTVMVRIGFKLGIGMEGGRPVTLTHRGGAWCPPLSCPSQWYSNLSLLWSELAFSWVLAWRVGILWHSHAGWEPGVSPCLVQVNGTPIFHCYGPNWLLAGYWHGGWASCDTHTPGGEPGVPPLSCSSQWYSSLSLSWSVLAYSWVLAWRVGFLWHSHIGGEPGVPRLLVQVNGTPVFHCYGPYLL